MPKIDNDIEINNIIRKFENTKYFGYMFYIRYDGSKFESFDENPNMISVKSEFKSLIIKNGINIFKGIQQAGRTDKYVNANENILYINSKNIIKFENLKHKTTKGLEILDIKCTMPFLEFPEMISKRKYIYEYPEKLIKNNIEKINSNCLELSGKKDFVKFTSIKGKKLKNHIREIYIEYKNNKLYFVGDAFLPQQVRIMSNYILNNKLEPLDGQYLTLDSVELSNELKGYIFEKTNIVEDKISFAYKNSYFYIFFVDKKYKSEIIGKRGKNIKKLKQKYGNIIIKEII